ncbi:MAG: sugar phosphate isomerase/epimerase [Armatimonadetes bacterium]|nr:sugar phosphate isomerase/epimerase [Armatimonadota bacterium]
MQVGFLTAPFGGDSLDSVVAFAAGAGFDSLEVASGPGSKHLDINTFSSADADRIKELFSSNNMKISSLAWYTDVVHPASRQEQATAFKKLVDAAHALDVDVVCTLAGMPVEGKDRFRTIDEDCKPAFTPLVEYAADKGIRICLENWFATNIQNLLHFDAIFTAVPHENFGLNYDPSHLVHQEIDYLRAVDEFKSRIFHSHAKDTEIRKYQRDRIGSLNGGWWRYVIPGTGVIDWGEYIAHLRVAGYDGVLSIEHEDGTVGREQGMEIGLRHLKQFI